MARGENHMPCRDEEEVALRITSAGKARGTDREGQNGGNIELASAIPEVTSPM